MIEIIKEKINEVAFKKVSNSDELFQSGILTSILVVDLATTLEDEFNISIPFNEIILESCLIFSNTSNLFFRGSFYRQSCGKACYCRKINKQGIGCF